MFSPRNAQTIAVLLISSFIFGIPAGGIAQTSASKPQAKATEAAKQKPDYSQEAVVIEQLSTAYRFERDGTGQRESFLRVKVQSDVGVERFGQLVFGYTSANEKLDMDYVRVRKADGTVVNAAVSDIQDLTAPVDNSPTKIIRRAALLCLPKPGGCSLTIINPDLIKSID